MNVDVDVVVVGGGLSGLTAARDLVRAGRTVQVLEARERVGGRTVSADLCGVAVDLGGTFVGPGQDRVLALAAELGCTTSPTRTEGDNLILWRGRLRRYHGTIPRIEAQALLDVERVRRLFGRHCRRVGRDRPWDSPVAARWDSVSLGGWLRSIRAGAGTRELFAILSRTTWGCETDEVSMYHALRYVRGCGGLDRMLDTEGGAQQDHSLREPTDSPSGSRSGSGTRCASAARWRAWPRRPGRRPSGPGGQP